MHGNSQQPGSIREDLSYLELQLQALEIIDEVLSGTADSEAKARSSLRWHVHANPGQPQRALLMHMLCFPRAGQV